MDIEVDVSDVLRMGARYQTVGPIVATELRTAMTRSVLQVERDAKAVAPVYTGTLRRSITHEVTAAAGGVVGKVGTNVPYAKIVEEGRTPGAMPPAGPILAWMSSKGIPAEFLFVVRRAINSRKVPRPYLKPALEKNRAAISREFALVPKRVLAKLGGR